MKNISILFSLLFALTFVACGDTTNNNADTMNNDAVEATTNDRSENDRDSRPQSTRLSVGDCMDFTPSPTMVAAPNPKKVACGSSEAKSKITKITKDKSECTEGYVTAYGSAENKSYYCVKAL